MKKNPPKDPIGEKLREVRKERELSVPELAELISIPSARIYKWEAGVSSPKFEDRKTIEEWIKLENWKNVPRETLEKRKDTESNQVNQKIYSVDYVELLKETNSMLKDIIKANLTELLTAQRLNRAQLTVITDLGTKTLATVQKRSLEMVREETSKNLNDIVARQLQTDTAAGT